MATEKFSSLLLLSMMVFALIILPIDSAVPGRRISLFRYGLLKLKKKQLFLIRISQFSWSFIFKNKLKSLNTEQKSICICNMLKYWINLFWYLMYCLFVFMINQLIRSLLQMYAGRMYTHATMRGKMRVYGVPKCRWMSNL